MPLNIPIRTPDQLAKVLRGYRKSMNLTQKEVGELVGLLPKTVSGLESSPEKSKLISLFKMLSALDLELEIKSKKNFGEKLKSQERLYEW